VCSGRSGCDAGEGYVCVGGKVCCEAAGETPCDPSGGNTRLCCDLSDSVCGQEDGEWDCFDKEEPPASGRRRSRRLQRAPGWALPAPPAAAGAPARGGGPRRRRRALRSTSRVTTWEG